MKPIRLLTVLTSLYACCLHSTSSQSTVQSLSVNVPLIIGLDVVGCGFDVTNLERREHLLDLDDINGASNWTDSYNQSLSYIVPHGFHVSDASYSQKILKTRIIKNISEFVTQTFYHSHQNSSGFLGFLSSETSVWSRTIHSRFYVLDNYLASTMRQFPWYSLSLVTLSPPKLSDFVMQIISTFPSTYNETNQTHFDLFQQFFNIFGTHVIVSSTMGGLVWAQDWFDSCLLRSRDNSWIQEQVRNRFHYFR